MKNKTESSSEFYKQFYLEDYARSHRRKYLEKDYNHWKNKHQRILELLGKPYGIKILDLGCGVGTYALEFAKMGNQTVGIDFSETLISFANKLREEMMVPQSQCKFILGDVSKPFFSDGEFDLIVAGDIIEHLPDPVLKATITECLRILKKGGTLFIHTYSYKIRLSNAQKKRSIFSCSVGLVT